MGIGERLRVPTHLLRRNILIKRKSTHNPCMIPCGLRRQNPMLLLCHHSFTFPFPAAVPPDIFSLLGYLCIVRHSPWFLLGKSDPPHIGDGRSSLTPSPCRICSARRLEPRNLSELRHVHTLSAARRRSSPRPSPPLQAEAERLLWQDGVATLELVLKSTLVLPPS